MGSTFKALVAAAFAACPLAAHGQTIEGNAQALAGNAINLAGTVIALRGIDAPAANQSCAKDGQDWSCGKDAQALLAQIVARGDVRCEGLLLRDGRAFAGTCRAGDLDLGEVMVSSGLALAVVDGGPDYSMEQAKAKSLKLGLWGAEFEAPSAWRAAHPQAAPAVKTARAAVAAQTVAEERPALASIATPSAARSRATTAAMATGSITCRERAITSRRGPKPCSAPKRKRLRPVTGAPRPTEGRSHS
jgi:endonuclease YncB( thermonuclease family)